ncbi:hypothetical protein N7492_002050 [Penicillium capsulatum]|uniref:Uncharacterized protein n=1 Tax=Penicillium capsulatum TaxID=69766 RepID=A0A9W9LVB6_9EURO|nr:hypothetical protein N7492_002050 [Penicillium capsulatum]
MGVRESKVVIDTISSAYSNAQASNSPNIKIELEESVKIANLLSAQGNQISETDNPLEKGLKCDKVCKMEIADRPSVQGDQILSIRSPSQKFAKIHPIRLTLSSGPQIHYLVLEIKVIIKMVQSSMTPRLPGHVHSAAPFPVLEGLESPIFASPAHPKIGQLNRSLKPLKIRGSFDPFYLAKTKAPRFPPICGLDRETIEHVLMECEDKRHNLRFDLFEKDVLMALNQELLSNRDAAEPVAKFMVRTACWGSSAPSTKWRWVYKCSEHRPSLTACGSDNFCEGSIANPIVIDDEIDALVAPSYSQDLAQVDSDADTETLSASEFWRIPTQSPLSDTVESDGESQGLGESEAPWMYTEFHLTQETENSSPIFNTSWDRAVDAWLCNSEPAKTTWDYGLDSQIGGRSVYIPDSDARIVWLGRLEAFEMSNVVGSSSSAMRIYVIDGTS